MRDIIGIVIVFVLLAGLIVLVITAMEEVEDMRGTEDKCLVVLRKCVGGLERTTAQYEQCSDTIKMLAEHE